MKTNENGSAGPAPSFANFEQFWPYYLRQHSKTQTRRLHIAGTIFAALNLIAFAFTGWIYLLVLALIGSYGPAWIGHGVFENNRPATFEYPAWSLRGDIRMVGLWLSGKLDAELQRFGINRQL